MTTTHQRMTRVQRQNVAQAAMIMADLCEREIVQHWSMTYDRPTPRSRHRAPLFHFILARQPFRVRTMFVAEVMQWAGDEYQRLGTNLWDAYGASWESRKRPVRSEFDTIDDEDE